MSPSEPMDNVGYHVLFDASQKGPDWWFPSFGLIFVAIGIGLVVGRKRLPELRFWRYHPRGLQILCWFFLGFALLWTAGSGVTLILKWHSVQSALSSGSANVVEGQIENFHPMPYTGHDDEHFTVGGVYFAYSDYAITPGFNQTSSHGGPVRGGLNVRIHYVSLSGQGNVIARLEVRS